MRGPCNVSRLSKELFACEKRMWDQGCPLHTECHSHYKASRPDQKWAGRPFKDGL